MLATVLSAVFAVLSGQADQGKNDAQLLVDTIESLQQPLADFRCEFEGTSRFKGKVTEYAKVGEDGLFETFSGVFIWKSGGDVHNEVLNRRAVDNRIARESVVVRTRQQQAEEYTRFDDAPLGYAVIKKPKEVKLSQHNSLASIFLTDEIKREVASDTHQTSVSDAEIDGRPLKVLSVALKNVPNSLLGRYWIDLHRSGQVVRSEGYQSGKVVSGRLDIKLAAFQVGGSEVWMPVYGEKLGYVALVDKKVVVTKEPTSIDTIYVVGGTMEVNRRPGPEVFTIKYKPGTPISDNLRKLEYEFAQQEIAPRPTKAGVEKMLKEQLAQAEEQKSTLAVASASESPSWYAWLASGFGALVVVSLTALWIQRRAR